jgi:membrane protein HdeD
MKTSFWTLVVGILMVVAGALSLINPFPASLTVTVFAGWAFIILGALQVVSAFRDAKGLSRILFLLLAVVAIWIGVLLINNPIAGLLALTVAVSLSFIASGATKLVLGWMVRSHRVGLWIMASGVLSLVLGILFMANLLGTAPWLLGVLLGIELLSDGVAAISLWYRGRSL